MGLVRRLLRVGARVLLWGGRVRADLPRVAAWCAAAGARPVVVAAVAAVAEDGDEDTDDDHGACAASNEEDAPGRTEVRGVHRTAANSERAGRS